MKVVVCLPTKNEEQSIQEMISRIKKLGYDLFLSDEASTDKTIEIAKKNNVPVYQRDGAGKGWGVKKAIEVAKNKGYETLVLVDCDCTYPPEYIPKMLKYFPEYDMVVGKRSMDNIPPLHKLPNLFHTLAINFLFSTRLSDINSGLRAFKIDKIDKVDAEGFDIEAQISVRAIKKGLKVKEIPIKYHQRKGDSKIRIKDGFVILKMIITERFTSLEKIKKHRYYKHSKNFSKYLFIGILWTIFNIFFMWLSIDILKFPTVYAASAVVIALFIGKFYAYRLISLIKNNFFKYAYTVIGFYMANVLFMWLFVDIIGWSALISSTIIVYSLFILRFIAFNLVGLIKK